MARKPVCTYCEQSGAKRDCPALNGTICPSCCGSNRNDSIRCPAECTYNPFGFNGYEEVLKLESSWQNKSTDYIIDAFGYDKYTLEQELKKFSIEGELDLEDPDGFSSIAWQFIHSKLFSEQFKNYQCLSDKWEQEQWKGLNNDEKLLMRFQKNAYPAVIEVQRFIDDTAMECIDLLDPDRKPFSVYDRTIVSHYVRFCRLLIWICHYQNYTRIGPAGTPIPFNTIDMFLDEMENNANGSSCSSREYLIRNFPAACRIIIDQQHKHLEQMISSIDMSEWTAIYSLNIRCEEMVEFLLAKPEIVSDEESDGEDDKIELLWLHDGESKKFENQTPDLLHTNDEDDGITGMIGRILVHPDRLVVITIGEQKFRFAREMIESYCSDRIVFRMESERNLKDEIGEMNSDFEGNEGWDEWNDEDDEWGADSVMDSDRYDSVHVEMVKELHNKNYVHFLNTPVAILNNMTPRQASQIESMHPKLVELMKQHIHQIERQNRQYNLDLEINSVLDELGLSALKA
jgi:hypothetical protein